MKKKSFELLLKSITQAKDIRSGKLKPNRTFEIYKHIRKYWDVKPITKIKQSNKLYSRKKEKEKTRRLINGES